MIVDSGRDPLSSDPARRYLAPLREYENTARRLFPALERWALDSCSISPADALFIGYFLEHGPKQMLVLEIGAHMGASTLCFASHPKVSRVISINPNPSVAGELAARSEPQPGGEIPGPLEDLKVLDVARAVIGEHPEQGKKVGFFEGEKLAEAAENAGLPQADSRGADADGLVVLVEGLRTRELISESLKATFGLDPRAVVLLDCRMRAGRPLVQAGVADFMDQTEDEYRFRMVGDLGPALSGGNLGILYPEAVAAETGKVLEEVGRAFSFKLDPLRLLGREEELMNTVRRINRQLSKTVKQNERLERRAEGLQKRIPRLEARIEKQKSRNADLLSQYSHIRYRAANRAAEELLKLPGAKEILVKAASVYRQGK